MVVTLSANDLFILNFILGSMKKHVKKPFIKQFGKEEGTSKYKIFKDTLKTLKQAKKDTNKEVYLIELNADQKDVLKMFIEGLMHRLKLEDQHSKNLKNLEILYQKVA